MEQIRLLLGERRRLTVRITAQGDFIIRAPTWQLLRYGGIEVEGVPEVDVHDMIVEIAPKQKGDYELEFTFEVASERIKKRVKVYVA